MENERIKEIDKECRRMQDFLEITTSDDPNELVGRLTDINVYMARSGLLLAECKAIQDKIIASVFDIYGSDLLKAPATIAKSFIASKTADINYYVNWLDRINRTCVHCGDNVRTQISFAKEELKLTRTGF